MYAKWPIYPLDLHRLADSWAEPKIIMKWNKNQIRNADAVQWDRATKKKILNNNNYKKSLRNNNNNNRTLLTNWLLQLRTQRSSVRNIYQCVGLSLSMDARTGAAVKLLLRTTDVYKLKGCNHISIRAFSYHLWCRMWQQVHAAIYVCI